jgi:hypothetical protein
MHACTPAQFTRQFLEKGNNVLAGARHVATPGLMELQKLHPDSLHISEIDVENQRSIIVRSCLAPCNLKHLQA